ncbi:hypothetical protein ACO1O0_009384 [Amphichorda felina]
MAGLAPDTRLGPGPGRQKRAFHRKVRTGCQTCKYASLLCLITNAMLNPRELRSYTYFLDVVAPSLSGFFDADFWLAELPRVCHADAAIWHAVVGLGAVHEAAGGPLSSGDASTSAFALAQANAAIRCLIESSSPRRADKGRALTVSAVFACMATLQGHHDQAAMHLRAGVNLLREVDGDDGTSPIVRSPAAKPSPPALHPLPVSLPPIRNLLLRMDMMSKALQHGGLVGSAPPSQILDNSIFRVWRSYRAPRAPSTLTPESLLAASRAAESLMNGVVYSSQEHGEALGALLAGDYTAEGREAQVALLAAAQRPHMRAYRELRRARRLFEAELDRPGFASPRASREQLRDALIPLRLFMGTCRMVLMVDPEEPDARARERGFPVLCRRIMDDARRVLGIGETRIEVGGKGPVAFTLNPTTLDAVFMVAHTAPTVALRREAADLMRRPRLEGLWHTVMAARLSDLVLGRELEAMGAMGMDLQGQGGEGDVDGDSGIINTDMGGLHGLVHMPMPSEQVQIPVMCRIRTIQMSFTGQRTAMVRLQTWAEWARGDSGQRRLLSW